MLRGQTKRIRGGGCLRQVLGRAWVHRRAQRKFRERQKAKLVESEERATELERALARMRMEKGALEARRASS